jgi:hypothetical protein
MLTSFPQGRNILAIQVDLQALSPRELVVRIWAILRRCGRTVAEAGAVLRFGPAGLGPGLLKQVLPGWAMYRKCWTNVAAMADMVKPIVLDFKGFPRFYVQSTFRRGFLGKE